MTTPKPPGKPGKVGTPKPFLGDDDLSELDAWVETFDALHMDAEGGAAQPGPDPPDLVTLEDSDPGSSGALEPADADEPLTILAPIDDESDDDPEREFARDV